MQAECDSCCSPRYSIDPTSRQGQSALKAGQQDEEVKKLRRSIVYQSQEMEPRESQRLSQRQNQRQSPLGTGVGSFCSGKQQGRIKSRPNGCNR